MTAGGLAPILWRPVADPLLIVSGAAIVAAIAVWAYRRPRTHPEAVDVYEAASAGAGPGQGYVLALLALRLSALAIIALILLGPSRLSEHQRTVTQQQLIMAIDTSASMGVADVSWGDGLSGRLSSRLSALQERWLDPEFLRRLGSEVGVRWYAFDRDLVAVDPVEAATMAATGEATRLVHNLRDLLLSRSTPDTAGIVLLSDGHDTGDEGLESLAALARSANVPLYPVVVGRADREPDLDLHLTVDHNFVYGGQSTTLRAEVRHVACADRLIELILTENGVEIERRQTRLGAGSARLTFDVRPRPTDPESLVGLAEYQIRVTPLREEKVVANNTRHAFVQVSRQHIKVALFENEPYWDTRFLIAALRDDAQVDLTTITGLGRSVKVNRYVPGPENGRRSLDDEIAAAGVDDAKQGVGADVPNTAESLFAFDIVILGRGVERWFPGESARLLVEFVTEHGGSLIMARGVPMSPVTDDGAVGLGYLESLSPIRWARDEMMEPGGALTRTPEGRLEKPLDFSGVGDSDLILSQLPGMLAQTRIRGEKTISTVWLRQSEPGQETDPDAETPAGPGYAAVAHQLVGKGRVLAVMTDGLWQWAFLPPMLDQFQSVYHLFWMRVIRWMAGAGELLPGQSIGLALSRLALEPGQTLEIVVQTRFIEAGSFQPVITIAGPDGQEHRLDPVRATEQSTKYTTSFRPATTGVFTVRLECRGFSPPEVVSHFAVYDPSRELIDTSARPGPLDELALATQGRSFGLEDREELVKELNRRRTAEVVALKPEWVWDRPWLLGLLLAVMGLEWLWRRWCHLP